MAMQNVFNILVDLKVAKTIPQPLVTQNDSVVFILEVMQDGVPFDLTDTTIVSLAHTRKDQTVVVTPGTKLGNKATFELGTNETSVTGSVTAKAQFYDVDGRVSTLSFSYQVGLDPTGSGYVPSASEATLIEVVLNDGPLIIASAEEAAAYANEQGDYALQVGVDNETRYLNAVSSVALRDSTYPLPAHGDTVRITELGRTDRYVLGTGWVTTDVYNPIVIDELSSQLAEKAEKAYAEATNLRVDNLVIPISAENANIEVTDAHVSTVKSKNFTTIRNRFEEIEADVVSAIAQPPTLLSVPAISDTYDVATETLTKNIGEANIADVVYAGILTDKSNYDYIYTSVIAGAKLGTAFPSGMTVYKDKTGVTLAEAASNSNDISNVGKYTWTNTGRLWIYVPKGAYATIADARLALGSTTLKYQLANPVTSYEEVGNIVEELNTIRTNTEDALDRVGAVETSIVDITSYLAPVVIAPPTLFSVPAISDTYVNTTLTKNVKEISLASSDLAGLITTYVNADYIFTGVIADAKVGTGGVIGQTIYKDKNGNVLVEGDNVDKVANIGKYAWNSTGRLWLYVAKGTYANLTDARAAVGTTTLRYQLTTPIVSNVESGFMLDLASKRDFKIETINTVPVSINFKNVPATPNSILSVSLNLKYTVATPLTFPSGVIWKNGVTPALVLGKTYLLFFMSYDAGLTWLSSVTGEW